MGSERVAEGSRLIWRAKASNDVKYSSIFLPSLSTIQSIADFVHLFFDLCIYVAKQALLNTWQLVWCISSFSVCRRIANPLRNTSLPLDRCGSLLGVNSIRAFIERSLFRCSMSFLSQVKETIHHGSDCPRIKVEGCWQSAI